MDKMKPFNNQPTSEDVTTKQTLNLARGLVGLQDRTLEYCTPGHRMGHSYQLLIAALVEAVVPDTAHCPVDTWHCAVHDDAGDRK